MCGSIMGPKLSICNIPLNESISRVVYGALNHPPPPPTRPSSSPSPGHDHDHFTNKNYNEDEKSLLSRSFLFPTMYTF